MFNFLLQMYGDRRGTYKNQPGLNLSDKRTSDKTPRQKPPRTIEIEFVQGAFVWDFCARPTKNGVGVRDV